MLTFRDVVISAGEFRLRADMTLPLGEVTAVIGPSGAGKSTLLSAVAGFLDVTGAIELDGVAIQGLAPAARPVSILFQDNNLFAHMTAYQNVALGVAPSLRLTKHQKGLVNDALARVDLAGFEGRKPAALSGGQQSRVALARILVREKPIVLLDEPFAALGPALKADMLDLVAEIADERSLSVLMVSHDPADARRIAGTSLLVADGKVHQPRDTKDLFDNPPAVLRDYLGE